MFLISLWTGKTIYVMLRLLNKRGGALPGYIVEKINAKFLSSALDKLPEGVIVVTGTNGKTTSTKMLVSILNGSGKKVLTNPTGSNFTRGVISAVIEYSGWRGKLDYDIAVIELDEAYASKFVKTYKPRMSIVLNVMRDQMDRYGEIDNTAILMKNVVANTTEFVILNRDDQRLYALKESTQARVVLFGVTKQLRSIFRNDDELYGDIKFNNDYALAELTDINNEKMTIIVDGKKYTFESLIYSVCNAQNICAVVAACYSLGLNLKLVKNDIAQIKPAFGRGECIYVNDKKIILQLVKNPGSFRYALMGSTIIKYDYALIAINDKYSDGRDVSWLWDVDFSSLKQQGINVTGSRFADIALRLQYEDIKVHNYNINLKESLIFALSKTPPKGTLNIYATYTAMLKLRELLAELSEVEKI